MNTTSQRALDLADLDLAEMFVTNNFEISAHNTGDTDASLYRAESSHRYRSTALARGRVSIDILIRGLFCRFARCTSDLQNRDV
jgi:hypothetical protein